MILCPLCGQHRPDAAALCPQHLGGPVDGWAFNNRIMCDLVHRGVAPSRLAAADRADDLAPHRVAA